MSDNRTDVLLEDINDKFETVLELVGTITDTAATKQDIAGISSEISELKSDIKIIKAATVDTSKEVATLQTRLTKLEAK